MTARKIVMTALSAVKPTIVTVYDMVTSSVMARNLM